MTRFLCALLLAVVVALAPLTTFAAPQTPDQAQATAAIVRQAALDNGVSPTYLVNLLSCESSLDPNAIGDDGTSFGLAQLHEGGLLGTFYAWGYTNPFSAWQSAEFAAGYIAQYGAGAWSCSYLLAGTTPPWW